MGVARKDAADRGEVARCIGGTPWFLRVFLLTGVECVLSLSLRGAVESSSVSRKDLRRSIAFELLLFVDREALVDAALEVVELRSC